MTIHLQVNGSYMADNDPGEPIVGARRVSITDEEGAILSELARDKVVVEVGTGLGISTRYLCRYADIVISYDIDPWVHAFIWPGLALEFHDDLVLCKQFPDLARVNMAFIDGCHNWPQVKEDIDKCLAIMDRPGILALHDARFLDFTGLGLGKVTVHDTTFGLAVVEVE